jgi:hypothetical protein
VKDAAIGVGIVAREIRDESRRMSLNAFQRRHPWIMTPLQWLSIVMTPERWPFLSPALAGAITRRLVVDTTRLARTIRRIDPLSAVREAALPGSPLLQSLDWRLRKLFWTALWCGGAIFLPLISAFPTESPRAR